MTEFFKLQNGVQLGSRQEVKAYIRGLELMRDQLNLSDADAAKVAAWLDDANTAKNTGALTAEQHEKREQAAREKIEGAQAARDAQVKDNFTANKTAKTKKITAKKAE